MEQPVSRKRLKLAFYGVIGLWITYGFYLWWMIDKYSFAPINVFPIAIGGLLLLRGSLLLSNVTPKLFGKNRFS